MSRYDIVWFHGKRVDKYTRQALQQVEKDLGYELTIVQGSYNKGVGASAGTHDSGGVVDLAPFDWQRKVKALRKRGFAAWYRPELWIGGRRIWGAHIHAVQIGNAKLHWTAANQVTDYRNHLNGLANKGWDSFWRPKKIKPFAYRSGKPIPKLPKKDVVKMSAIKYQGRSKAFTLKAGKAIIPRITNGKAKSFAWRTGSYHLVEVELTLSGLPRGEELQAKIVKTDYKIRAKQVGGSDIEEIIGTGGKTFGRIVTVIYCGKNQGLRLRLQTFNKDITVHRIVAHTVTLS